MTRIRVVLVYMFSDISWRMYHTLTMLYHATNPTRSYWILLTVSISGLTGWNLQVNKEVTNRITWGTILQDTIIATLDEWKKDNLREERIKNKHI